MNGKKTSQIALQVFFAVILGSLEGCNNGYSNSFKEWLFQFPYPFLTHSGDAVLATFGSLEITRSDFEGYRQHLSGIHASAALLNNKKTVLDQLIRSEIMTKLATDSGVRLNSNQKQQLNSFLNVMLASDFEKQISVSDEEIQDYYAQHSSEFAIPNSTVSILSFKTLSQAQNAKNLPQKNQSLLMWEKENISNSTTPHPMTPREKTIFALKTGEVSNPIATSSGYELIRREASNPLPSQPTSVSKEEIRKLLQLEKANQMVSKWIETNQVKINENVFNSLHAANDK